jgi:large subunit ribosomal protein L21
VSPGNHLKVEKIEGAPGDKIRLDKVLAVHDDNEFSLGTPFVEGAAVEAVILRTAKDRKIIVFKKHRRHGFKKKQGHRQWFTLLKVDSIAKTPAAVEAAPAE